MPFAKVADIDIFDEIAEVEQQAAPMLPCSNALMLEGVQTDMPYANVNSVDILYEIAEMEQRAPLMLPCSNAPMLKSAWN